MKIIVPDALELIGGIRITHPSVDRSVRDEYVFDPITDSRHFGVESLIEFLGLIGLLLAVVNLAYW